MINAPSIVITKVTNYCTENGLPEQRPEPEYAQIPRKLAPSAEFHEGMLRQDLLSVVNSVQA